MIINSILCFNLVGPRPQLNGCCHQGEGRGLVFQSTEHFDQDDEDGGSDHCDKSDKVWQKLQSTTKCGEHWFFNLRCIMINMMTIWWLWSLWKYPKTPLATFFWSLSEVLPEHHRDPRAKREASQNLGSSPVDVRLYETLQIFQPP